MSYQISKRLISDVAVKNTEIFFILGTINLIQSYCAEVFENPSSHSIKNEKSDTGESFYSISFNFCCSLEYIDRIMKNNFLHIEISEMLFMIYDLIFNILF